MKIISFKELCEELHLNTQDSKQYLGVLRNWCEHNISSDIEYSSGTHLEQYQQYLNLAERFCDVFLTNIPSRVTSSVAKFSHMNSVQYAAANGFDRYIQTLCQTEPQASALNLFTKDHMAPLHLAARKGHLNTVAVLLRQGAAADIKNHSEQIPAFSALTLPVLKSPQLKSRKIKIYQELQRALPIFKETPDSNGDTVCHLMAVNGFHTLVKDCLNINSGFALFQNHNGQTPLHTAILHNQLACANLLFAVPDASKVADSKKRVPLHYAARNGSLEMIRLACDYSVNLNSCDTDGKTAFILATERKRLSAMEELALRGVDTTCTDSSGRNALHYAALSGNANIVLWVLSHTSIDPSAPDVDGKSPLDLSTSDEINEAFTQYSLAKMRKP